MGQSLLFLALALPACLAVVVLSAAFFVRGAVSIAHRLSVPEFLVGSVIVAVGTSAPEVSINVSAALGSAGDIVISNIVGSNIVNIALGIGISACILSFQRARKEYTNTIIVGGLGALALLVLTLFTAQDGGWSFFSRGFGAAFMLAFCWFMWDSIRSADGSDDEPHVFDEKLPLAIAMVIGGAIAMAIFSNLSVEYAVALANRAGIPEAVIGATIIAAGGSLPEVSSCIVAARYGRPNLILGNVAGSQVFNILGILGLSGLITGFAYHTHLWVDMSILLAMTGVLLVCIRFERIRPVMGPVLLACYGIYAVYLIIQAT